MFSTFNFVDFVIILPGVILVFKRVTEMERYHVLRVVALTTILSFFLVLFFLSYGFTESLWEVPCRYGSMSDGHFTCSEM